LTNNLCLTLECPKCEKETLMMSVGKQYQDGQDFQVCMECEECKTQVWWEMKVLDVSGY